jgi:hypothetical protein
MGHPDYERLLLNSLRFVGGSPAVVVEAPTTVQATFFEQREHDRIIIHLLSRTYDQMFPAPATGIYVRFSRGVFRPVGDVIPVRDIRASAPASIRGGIARLLSLTTSEEVPHELHGGAVRFSVPELDEYDACVLQYGG